MENKDNLNYKWFWIAGIIGFVIALLLVTIGILKTLVLLAITGLSLGIGIVVDLVIIKKREEKDEPLPGFGDDDDDE